MKNVSIIVSFLFVLVAASMAVSEAEAYQRYNDGCQSCHGDFTGGTSPKGSTFPNNNKHTMHRSSSYMNADCSLCHRSDDGRDPFIGSSDGTEINPGLGCNGCHDAVGLRAHHVVSGISSCFTTVGCHDADPVPSPENTMPVYYGTADTDADMPCNPDPNANVNENWTIDDFVGLDNDGDGLYDGNDPDCAEPECTVDADCDNGQFCDGDETCDTATNTCQAGSPPSCDDGVACTLDTCDEINDACENTPDDASCDDGASCNGAEFCDEIDDCQPGTPTNCDDGVGCTDDSCNEAADLCVNTPNNANCPDDGLFCNGFEVCDPSAGCSSQGDPCQPGTICNEETDTCEQVPQCGDGNLDPDEVCDEGAANGTTRCGCQNDCTYTPANTECDDGQFCNAGETCDGAGTCAGGSPLDCSDDVGCTDDSCDEDNASCVNTPNNGNCTDDGLFCTGEEFCDAVNDCSSTGDPCVDGEICNEDTGTCDPQPRCGDNNLDPNEQCDDGAANGTTRCGCQNDCTYTPANTECDDGQFCNAGETCDGAGTCAGGSPLDCSDDVGCTDDSCDEDNASCVNTPNNGNCTDDGLFCTGEEFCDAVNDCSSTGDPCVDGEICNEDTGTCDAPPVVIDLDIARFSVTKSIRLAKVKPVDIKLVVINNGTANSQTREATVTGMQMQDGVVVEVFAETQDVSDEVGNGRSTFNFGPYEPVAAGDIIWTVIIDDDDTDDDTATAVTSVK